MLDAVEPGRVESGLTAIRLVGCYAQSEDLHLRGRGLSARPRACLVAGAQLGRRRAIQLGKVGADK